MCPSWTSKIIQWSVYDVRLSSRPTDVSEIFKRKTTELWPRPSTTSFWASQGHSQAQNQGHRHIHREHIKNIERWLVLFTTRQVSGIFIFIIIYRSYDCYAVDFACQGMTGDEALARYLEDRKQRSTDNDYVYTHTIVPASSQMTSSQSVHSQSSSSPRSSGNASRKPMRPPPPLPTEDKSFRPPCHTPVGPAGRSPAAAGQSPAPAGRSVAPVSPPINPDPVYSVPVSRPNYSAFTDNGNYSRPSQTVSVNKNFTH